MRTGEYGKVQHTASGRQSGVSRRFRLALSARRPTTYAQLDACSPSLVWLLLLLCGLDTRGQCAPENPSQRGIYLASSVRLLTVKRAPHQGLIVACGTARMNYRHLTGFMGSRRFTSHAAGCYIFSVSFEKAAPRRHYDLRREGASM